jgi:hypothetical protein
MNMKNFCMLFAFLLCCTPTLQSYHADIVIAVDSLNMVNSVNSCGLCKEYSDIYFTLSHLP